MIRLKVVAPMGATIRGPARVALTPDQHRKRAADLGPLKKSGLYDLPDGSAMVLKLGEEFGLESDAKLNRALFEEVEKAPKKKSAGDDEAARKAAEEEAARKAAEEEAARKAAEEEAERKAAEEEADRNAGGRSGS